MWMFNIVSTQRYITNKRIFLLYLSQVSPEFQHFTPHTSILVTFAAFSYSLHLPHTTWFAYNTHNNLLFNPMPKNSCENTVFTSHGTSTGGTLQDLTAGEVNSLPERLSRICVSRPIAKVL